MRDRQERPRGERWPKFRLSPRAGNRLGEGVDRPAETWPRPSPQVPLEKLLLPKSRAGETRAFARPFLRVALGAMQLEPVTQRRREQCMIIAGSSKMAQACVERGEAAIEGRIHRLAENKVRCVTDNGRDMIEGDVARAMRVKHEFFKFGAGRKPVLAELGNEKRLGVRRNDEIRRRNLESINCAMSLAEIGIALDRRGVLGALGSVARKGASFFNAPASMTTVQSRGGATRNGSNAAINALSCASMKIARRPPNRGMVLASSASRAGSLASSSPAIRTS